MSVNRMTISEELNQYSEDLILKISEKIEKYQAKKNKLRIFGKMNLVKTPEKGEILEFLLHKMGREVVEEHLTELDNIKVKEKEEFMKKYDTKTSNKETLSDDAVTLPKGYSKQLYTKEGKPIQSNNNPSQVQLSSSMNPEKYFDMQFMRRYKTENAFNSKVIIIDDIVDELLQMHNTEWPEVPWHEGSISYSNSRTGRFKQGFYKNLMDSILGINVISIVVSIFLLSFLITQGAFALEQEYYTFYQFLRNVNGMRQNSEIGLYYTIIGFLFIITGTVYRSPIYSFSIDNPISFSNINIWVYRIHLFTYNIYVFFLLLGSYIRTNTYGFGFIESQNNYYWTVNDYSLNQMVLVLFFPSLIFYQGMIHFRSRVIKSEEISNLKPGRQFIVWFTHMIYMFGVFTALMWLTEGIDSFSEAKYQYVGLWDDIILFSIWTFFLMPVISFIVIHRLKSRSNFQQAYPWFKMISNYNFGISLMYLAAYIFKILTKIRQQKYVFPGFDYYYGEISYGTLIFWVCICSFYAIASKKYFVTVSEKYMGHSFKESLLEFFKLLADDMQNLVKSINNRFNN